MAKLYGVLLAILGMLLMSVGLLLEGQFSPKAGYALIALKLMDELGIALFLAGSVAVLLEFRDWQKYFQERIKSVMFEHEYLRSMGGEQLMALHTKTLKAYFKTEDIERQGSFLEFFRSRIQAYIGSPYRESVLDNVNITFSSTGRERIDVVETISYRCRKIGDKIQADVRWVESGTEQIKQIEFTYCSIELKLPSGDVGRSSYPRLSPIRTFKSTDVPNIIEYSGPGKGFVLSLEKYGYDAVDDLQINVTVHYSLPTNLSFTWTMSHPTKGLTGTVTYPSSLELVANWFGLIEDQVKTVYNPGSCQVSYNSWVLPDTGISFQLIEKADSTVKVAKANQAVTNKPSDSPVSLPKGANPSSI
jgi:hypothetical protein